MVAPPGRSTVSTSTDSGTITLEIPEDFQNRVVQLLATVESLEVTPDNIAKVVLNEKTGTVVIGEKVRISTVAVAHGNLSIQITERASVSQPSPFAPTPPLCCVLNSVAGVRLI